jgi:hypothetical protein
LDYDESNSTAVKLNRSIQNNFFSIKNWKSSNSQSAFGFSSTLANSSFQVTENILTRLEPNLSLIIILRLNKITFNYSLNHQLPAVRQLQQTDVVLDFQTLLKPSGLIIIK